MYVSILKRAVKDGQFRKLLSKRARQRVVVVIPVYKPEPDEQEAISLKRCMEVLGSHPVVLVSPDGLDLSAYFSRYPGLKVIRFAAHFFEGIAGYNQLTLNPYFYEQFLDYQYMLIYQLDCYVFRDELLFWCRQGYDYIGAPWMDEYSQQALYNEQRKNIIRGDGFLKKKARKLIGSKYEDVGNGGLSLRRVKTFVLELTVFAKAARQWPYYEDLFFSAVIPCLDITFRVPDQRTAMKFAVETHPGKCFRLLGEKLPFGCHAWNKYEQSFWHKFITEHET